MISKMIVVFFLLCITPVGSVPVPKSQGIYPSAQVVQPKSMTSEAHVQSIIDFWTEDKFRQAKSPWELYPGMFNSTEIARRRLDDASFHENGPAFAVNAVEGLTGSNLRAQAGGYGRPTTGKVFWSLGNNYYGMCSASVIASHNRDLLVTAAHCIFDANQGGFLVNHQWVFVPGYHEGHRPHGTFPARSMTTFRGWTDSTDWNFDVGFVLVSEANGRHVQDAVGGQGMGFNFGRNELIYAFGYPLNLDRGEMMQFCRSHTGGHQAGGGYHGQRLDCDMAGGSSGGPWIQLYNTGSGLGYVTSVNSFILGGQHNSLHGPYFSNDVHSLFESVKG